MGEGALSSCLYAKIRAVVPCPFAEGLVTCRGSVLSTLLGGLDTADPLGVPMARVGATPPCLPCAHLGFCHGSELLDPEAASTSKRE